jgi:PAS domain S-box-containing protein
MGRGRTIYTYGGCWQHFVVYRVDWPVAADVRRLKTRYSQAGGGAPTCEDNPGAAERTQVAGQNVEFIKMERGFAKTAQANTARAPWLRAIASKARWLRLGVWFAACLLPGLSDLKLATAASSGPASSTEVLTTAKQVRLLTIGEAGQGRPVRLRGMVTLYRPDWQLFFVQDLTGGVYLYSGQRYPGLKAGEWVEVEGRTQAGRVSPIVLDETVRRLKPEDIPASAPMPDRVSLDAFRDGRVDCQWVELEAMVRKARLDAQRLVLEFGPEAHRISFSLPWSSQHTNLVELLYSRTRVRGVCTFEKDGDYFNARLFANSPQDLQVIDRGLRNPFARPKQGVLGTLQTVPATNLEAFVHVQGVVTHKTNDTYWFIQDGPGAVAVRTDSLPDARVGDEVEVAGFLSRFERPACVEDSVVRRLNRDVPVTPRWSSMGDLQNADLCGQLVTVEGLLVDHVRHPERDVLTLEAANTLVSAELADTNELQRLTILKPESLLRLTGILLPPPQASEGLKPCLLLRSAADVKVLRLPTWWTTSHILTIIGGLMATSSLALAWAVSLRHQVRRQTEQIRHRLESEAALEQRYRDLIEGANDVIWTMDREARFLSVNRAGEQILGVSREELCGRAITDFVTPDFRPEIQKLLHPETDHQKASIHELAVVCRDGTRRILEVSSRPFAPDPQTHGVQAIARDVTERRKAATELAKVQQELVHTSRLAGMAEVATDVLHNVGNVLNSVNVSMNLLHEHHRQSVAVDFHKLAALVCDHRADLGEFLTRDVRGRLVPEFMGKLSERLRQEQADEAQELALLKKNIDHIKEIVAMQQNYARVSGVLEKVSLVELMDHALQINAAGLSRHEVEVQRAYAPIPELILDKHKVLQILVNLVHNAKYALDDCSSSDRWIHVEIAMQGPDRVRLIVADNGVGIPPENLTRIFHHGFTTRKNGHGFGLHNGANAAREMGGSLTAASAGAGQGAAFTLELPVTGQETNS